MLRTALIFILLLAFNHEYGAEALPSFLEPEKGWTAEGQIKCYSLPYGALGFVSHILTYYTIVCMWYRRKPYMPWKSMRHPWFDTIIGIISLTWTVAITVFTIFRCRNGWQYMLIAVWKLFMSITLGISTISAALSTRPVRKNSVTHSNDDTAALISSDVELESSSKNSRHRGDGERYEPLRRAGNEASRNPQSTILQTMSQRQNHSKTCVWLYVPGIITGYVGLFALVGQYWKTIPAVQHITYYMLVAPAVTIAVFILILWGFNKQKESPTIVFTTLLSIALVGMGIVGALYSDWILAAIAGNYSGYPSNDGSLNFVFFWSYFIAKRLPLGCS